MGSFNKKMFELTGLTYDFEKIITESENPEKLFESFSWHIPRGRYLENSEVYSEFKNLISSIASETGIKEKMDVNEDGVVNEEDVEIIKENIGKDPSTSKGDVNKDNTIDEEDVELTEEVIANKIGSYLLSVSKKLNKNPYDMYLMVANDGINEMGLVCNINVVPTGVDIPPTKHTNEGAEPLSAASINRYLLDNCANVEEAIIKLANRDIYCPYSDAMEQEFHIMCGDSEKSVIFEFTYKDSEGYHPGLAVVISNEDYDSITDSENEYSEEILQLVNDNKIHIVKHSADIMTNFHVGFLSNNKDNKFIKESYIICTSQPSLKWYRENRGDRPDEEYKYCWFDRGCSLYTKSENPKQNDIVTNVPWGGTDTVKEFKFIDTENYPFIQCKYYPTDKYKILQRNKYLDNQGEGEYQIAWTNKEDNITLYSKNTSPLIENVYGMLNNRFQCLGHLVSNGVVYQSDDFDYSLLPAGTERYSLLRSLKSEGINSVSDMQDVMEALKYTNSYRYIDDEGDWDKTWWSEFVGAWVIKSGVHKDEEVIISKEDIVGIENNTIDSDKLELIKIKLNEIKDVWNNRVRPNGCWESSHTTVIDIANRQLNINVKEDYTSSHTYSFDMDTEFPENRVFEEVLNDDYKLLYKGTIDDYDFDELQKDVAERYGAGKCSSIYANGYYGRNLDWYETYYVTSVVKVNHKEDEEGNVIRYASINVLDTDPDITKETMVTNVNNFYGKVLVNDEEVDSKEFGEGEKVSVKAVPENGYKFVKWNDGKKTNPRDVVLSENKSLQAEFTKK